MPFKPKADSLSGVQVSIKNINQKCAFVLIADGFNEIEAVVILSIFRQAGLFAKSVGLTSGLINGMHGIQLQPDLKMTDLYATDPTWINALILPGDDHSLAKIEADPRLPGLLHQVYAQQGLVAASDKGRALMQTALGDAALKQGTERVVLWPGLEQAMEPVARDLARRVG